jgi:DNA primase
VGLFEGWRVVLALDADRAGRAGADRIARMFNATGQAVRVLELPEGLDVNDYLSTMS